MWGYFSCNIEYKEPINPITVYACLKHSPYIRHAIAKCAPYSDMNSSLMLQVFWSSSHYLARC